MQNPLPIVLVGLCLVAGDPSSSPSELSFGESAIHALEVPDPAAAARWYGRALGCELELDLSELGWCEVSTPLSGLRIGLGRPEPGVEPRGSGGAKLSLEVKDLERAREVLVERGVEVGTVLVVPDTVKLLDFQDPWGNRLMLFQPLDS